MKNNKQTIIRLSYMLKKSLKTINDIMAYNLQDRCEGVLLNSNDWHKYEFINNEFAKLNKSIGRKNIVKV